MKYLIALILLCSCGKQEKPCAEFGMMLAEHGRYCLLPNDKQKEIYK